MQENLRSVCLTPYPAPVLGGDENKVNKTKVEKENSNMLNKQNITGRAILAAAVIIGTSTTFAGGFAQPDTASKASAPRGNVTFETTVKVGGVKAENGSDCLLYTSPSPRD